MAALISIANEFSRSKNLFESNQGIMCCVVLSVGDFGYDLNESQRFQ